MRVLVIGGNRFLGIELTALLLARGHRVTLLNRGNLSDPFGPLVQRYCADRGTDAFDAALEGSTWDAVVDFALFDGPQAQRLLRVLDGRVGHLIVISTGQVYLVRTPRPSIASERDYAGATLAAPPTPREEPDWRYGIEKRDAEDVLRSGRLPHTIFRLPMVHGGRDHKRRLDSLLWRLMDGGPIFLTQPDAPVKQVFSGAVSRALVAAVERGPVSHPDDGSLGKAYNLAWDEALTARGLVDAVAQCLGTTARVRTMQSDVVRAAGIDPYLACSVNSEWMSALDATVAQRELAFVHEPLQVWLPAALQGCIARWDGPPPSMSQREIELRLAH
jgi:nucleoside-diphosphate-sugar epimerase